MVSLSAVNASIRKHQIWEVLKNPLKIRLEIVLFWINTFIFSIQILIFKSISVILKSFNKKLF